MPTPQKKVTRRGTRTRGRKRVLLFGGGGCHDFRACCPVLKRYLRSVETFDVDYVAGDLDVFTAERLAPYDLVVVYHTGGELTVEQKRGLVEGVASGKGFVGVHAAADSFKSSPEYLAMVGGVFRRHPCQRTYIVSLADAKHPVTRDLQGYTIKHWEQWPVYEFPVQDEQYLLDYDPRVHVLATTVFRGNAWPVSWVKPWGKGKVFYLALGHHVEACRNRFFRDLFLGGSRWAASRRAIPVRRDPRFDIV